MGDIGMQRTTHMPAAGTLVRTQEDKEEQEKLYKTRNTNSSEQKKHEEVDVEAQNRRGEKINLLTSENDEDDDDVVDMKKKKEKKTNSKKNMWRMWAMLYPERYRLAMGFAFLTVSSLTQVFIPHYRT